MSTPGIFPGARTPSALVVFLKRAVQEPAPHAFWGGSLTLCVLRGTAWEMPTPLDEAHRSLRHDRQSGVRAPGGHSSRSALTVLPVPRGADGPDCPYFWSGPGLKCACRLCHSFDAR